MKIPIHLTHLGAESTVTGSCHLLQTRGLNILVDCGIAQGADTAIPMYRWPVRPDAIDFLFLTHAHIDHIGRVPELLQHGFAGEIICTHATRALLLPMLEDALHFTQLPMGREDKDRVLAALEKMSWGFEFQESFDLGKGIRFTLGRAGHILGSCWIRFDLPDGGSLVFSGDLGARNTPILADPDIPDPCDLLILESTYGDRCHEDRSRRIERLALVLKKALADRGKVLIPAFALGRTQEILYEIDRLFSDPGGPWGRSNTAIPVFIDTPLGLTITRIYFDLARFWDQEAKERLEQGDDPLDFDHLYGVATHTDHLKLLDVKGPAIIVAGSGMCTGGRIIDHLKACIDEPTTDILFIGYQAHGTPGREMLQFAGKNNGYVTLDGAPYTLRAAVHSLRGYSAHADQRGLLEWATAIQPRQVKLVHGQPGVKRTLTKLFQHNGLSTT